jgi:hypothetical protein
VGGVKVSSSVPELAGCVGLGSIVALCWRGGAYQVCE